MTDYLGGALDVNNIPVDDKREKLKERIALLIDYAWLGVWEEPSLRSLNCAERILKEIEHDKG
jgi:hypothetical protein